MQLSVAYANGYRDRQSDIFPYQFGISAFSTRNTNIGRKSSAETAE